MVKKMISSYSNIIAAEEYNHIIGEQHIYVKETDNYVINIVKNICINNNVTEFVELGCGPARVLKKLISFSNLNITAIDVDQNFLDYTAYILKDSDAKVINASMLDYKHNKEVNIFYSQGVHHHIKLGYDRTKYLTNISKQLSNNGIYILADEFIPNYKDLYERDINLIIWYSHVISDAIKNKYTYLAEEEAKTLLDDLFECKDITNIKTQVQIRNVLEFSAKIDLVSQIDLDKAKLIAKELRENIFSNINVNKIGDNKIDLSRGDYKISLDELSQELRETGLKIKYTHVFGDIEKIGGLAVVTIVKA